MKKYIVLFVLLLYNAALTAQLKNISTTGPALEGNMAQQQLIILPQSYTLVYNNPATFLNTFKKTPEERKKHYILRGILIGGAIGIAPVVFGEGGAYVAVFSFPIGLITGAILGAAAKRRHRSD